MRALVTSACALALGACVTAGVPRTPTVRVHTVGTHALSVGTLAPAWKELESLPDRGPTLVWYALYESNFVDTAANKMLALYYDHGYVEARVDGRGDTSRDRSTVDVTFTVQEGAQYTLRTLRVTDTQGADLTDADARALLGRVHTGVPFSRGAIAREIERLKDVWQEQGYAFVEVDPVVDMDHDAHTLDVRLRVDPGHRVRVQAVRIVGEDGHDAHIALPTLVLGAWFRRTDVERAAEELKRKFPKLTVSRNMERGDGDDGVKLQFYLDP